MDEDYYNRLSQRWLIEKREMAARQSVPWIAARTQGPYKSESMNRKLVAAKLWLQERKSNEQIPA